MGVASVVLSLLAFALGIAFLILTLISHNRALPNKKMDALSPWWPYCKDCYPKAEEKLKYFGRMTLAGAVVIAIIVFLKEM